MRKIRWYYLYGAVFIAVAVVLSFSAAQTTTDPAATAAGVLNAAGGLYTAVAQGMQEVSIDHATIGAQSSSISSLQSRTSLSFTATITPTAIAAASCADESFPVTGIVSGDLTIAQVPSGATLGQVSMSAESPAAGSVRLHFCNPTASSQAPPAGAYKIAQIR